MDEIVRALQDRVGLDEQTARKAATTVLNVLQDRLPEPVAGQLRKLTDGDGGSGDSGGSGAGLGDVAKNIGGMFGG